MKSEPLLLATVWCHHRSLIEQWVMNRINLPARNQCVGRAKSINRIAHIFIGWRT